MKLDWLKSSDNWSEVKRACRNTVNLDGAGKDPDSNWKTRLLMSEHSPIRKLRVEWRWSSLKYWVSVHFTRHWLGLIHFVGTQRTDRTGEERDSKSQDALVTHEVEGTAQAMINVSRKRLCFGASPETREAWERVKEEVATVEPELARCMVKECCYRGFCPEFVSCGYHRTESYRTELAAYRKGINE